MENRRLLALAIQRMPQLRPEEKMLLWDVVADERALAALKLSDAQAIIGRRLEGSSWKPASVVVAAESDARFLERIGAIFVHFDEAGYPPLLRESTKPPFGLYVRGASLPAESPAVAIVGTRCPTGRGIAAARDLASGLAAAGIPVVSGLARGIDAAAHRGALEARGFTCAVLPCGIDAIYPVSNRALAASILESGGLLLSEYAPGTAIHKYRFPERNRIIATLARACIVIEAPLGSGALITSDHALSEGRDVWVSRVCLRGPRSAGIDRLASEGAPCLDWAHELLADWDMTERSVEAFGNADRGIGRDTADEPGTGPIGSRLAGSLRVELGIGDPVLSSSIPQRKQEI